MGRWKAVAWTAAIVAAAGVGAALGPVAYGQGAAVRIEAKNPRAVQIISGQGSWIGVSVREVGTDEAGTIKLPGPGGAYVDDVTRDSPAETAGVKAGDVIVEFDGERVRGTRQLTRLVQETPGGRKVQVAVMRDGQRVVLSVEPQASGRSRYMGDFDGLPEIAGRWFAAPPAPPVPPAPPGAPAPPAPPVPPAMRGFFDFDELVGRGSVRLGVTVSDLQPQLAEYFAVHDGVLVSSVTAESSAAKAGVKAGDVITTLNGAAVSSPSDLRQRASRLNDGDELVIGIVRDKKPMTLKGKVEGVSPRRRTVTVL
jgi:serine protease Do